MRYLADVRILGVAFRILVNLRWSRANTEFRTQELTFPMFDVPWFGMTWDRVAQ